MQNCTYTNLINDCNTSLGKDAMNRRRDESRLYQWFTRLGECDRHIQNYSESRGTFFAVSDVYDGLRLRADS
ncbi:hypothetical protein [Nostoc sp. NMS4]|uniref:hypothetical protein n=1 Tax=Nostoc sp. NMS4 TaxID=2815390 RepID=UPI0025E722C7|nr:hypothetical protein [Nostoc sp. NMS4]MBN3923026.1 hypothetical protein [Nostoc sp. NMS4]